MKQKYLQASLRIVHDITMWTILIFSLFILNSSEVFGQYKCEDNLIKKVSENPMECMDSKQVNALNQNH